MENREKGRADGARPREETMATAAERSILPQCIEFDLGTGRKQLARFSSDDRQLTMNTSTAGTGRKGDNANARTKKGADKKTIFNTKNGERCTRRKKGVIS